MVSKATISKIKKNGVVAIIFLFISTVFAPSIHAKIQQETLDEISTIFEENEFIRNYIEKNSDEDCACENGNTIRWNFPTICTLLLPLFVLGLVLILGIPHFSILYEIMIYIGSTLNCFWYRNWVLNSL